jgi:hypothetical protein
MAESKSDHFSFEINAHSEKIAKFDPLSTNRLPVDSECGHTTNIRHPTDLLIIIALRELLPKRSPAYGSRFKNNHRHEGANIRAGSEPPR